jgi:GDSL-like Lipase/Acylhydrolase family
MKFLALVVPRATKLSCRRAVLIAGLALGACSDDSTGTELGAPPASSQVGDASAAVDASSAGEAGPLGGASGTDSGAGVQPVDGGVTADAAIAPLDAAIAPLGEGGALQPEGGTTRADSGSQPDGSAAGVLRPKCVKKDSQVIMVGDSYINWISHSFPADLAKNSGQQWRNYAIGGQSLATGGIGLLGLGYIPEQLDTAIAEDRDFHTLIMDGGGNDILVADPFLAPNSCTASGAGKDPACQMIVQRALQAAKASIDKAAAAGVRDVVYFFYPHVPANTILSDDNPNEILDYALPMAKAMCDGTERQTSGKMRCTFVDMVPVFAGHPDYFNEDIHPNDTGSKAMADKIWQVMTDKCLGQKTPKDCCES